MDINERPVQALLTIASVSFIFADVLSITFADAPWVAEAGQFITLELLTTHQHTPYRRSYSLVNLPTEPMTIVVKRQPNGLGSNYLFNYAKVGLQLLVQQPTGRFTLPAVETDNLAIDLAQNQVHDEAVINELTFIGAGSGLVPLYPLLRTALADDRYIKINWLVTDRYLSRSLFFNEIIDLARAHKGRLHLTYFVTSCELPKSDAARDLVGDSGGAVGGALEDDSGSDIKGNLGVNLGGDLHGDLRGDLHGDLHINLHGDIWPLGRFIAGHLNNSAFEQWLLTSNIKLANSAFYLCGPADLMRILKFELRYLKVPADAIKQEQFVVPTIPKTIEHYEAQTGEIVGKGKLTIDANETLLNAGLRTGYALPFSCQAGQCSACMAQLVTGQVRMTTNEVLTTADLEQGLFLPCTAHPTGPVVWRY